MAVLIPTIQAPSEAVSFAEIASKIRPRLALYCGLDSSYVLPVANADYDITIVEDFFLYFQVFDIDAFGDNGAGRLNPWATRRLRVYVYTRSGVDPYGEDEVALLGLDSDPAANEGIGHFAAEELVIGALYNWMPLNADNRARTIEPFHPATGSGPPLRKAENGEGLLRSALDFEIKYVLLIDKRDPPV